jgi:hypothetical protein
MGCCCVLMLTVGWCSGEAWEVEKILDRRRADDLEKEGVDPALFVGCPKNEWRYRISNDTTPSARARACAADQPVII